MKWTQKHIDELVKMRFEGKSFDELAIHFGVSKRACSTQFNLNKMKDGTASQKIWTTEELKKLDEIRSRTSDIYQIANHLKTKTVAQCKAKLYRLTGNPSPSEVGNSQGVPVLAGGDNMNKRERRMLCEEDIIEKLEEVRNIVAGIKPLQLLNLAPQQQQQQQQQDTVEESGEDRVEESGEDRVEESGDDRVEDDGGRVEDDGDRVEDDGDGEDDIMEEDEQTKQPRVVWTREKLSGLRHMYRVMHLSWKEISLVFGASPTACAIAYHRNMVTGCEVMGTPEWSSKELQFIQSRNMTPRDMSRSLRTKSVHQCSLMMKRLEKKRIQTWTKQEDKKLRWILNKTDDVDEIVSYMKPKSWEMCLRRLDKLPNKSAG